MTTMKKYNVSMTMTVEFTVCVEAENESQAETIAMDKAVAEEAYYLKHYNSVWEREVQDVQESEDDEPEDDKSEEKSHIDKAIDYVRENMSLDDLAILRANIDKSYAMHLVPDEYTPGCDRVVDLLEEYGLEHLLEDRWWEDERDIDQILIEI